MTREGSESEEGEGGRGERVGRGRKREAKGTGKAKASHQQEFNKTDQVEFKLSSWLLYWLRS